MWDLRWNDVGVRGALRYQKGKSILGNDVKEWEVGMLEEFDLN
jgi:hypothetical protein